MKAAPSGPELFVTDFVAKLRARATDLRTYGAEGQAVACERTAQDLEDDFRAWWLAGLSVSEAAAESGYTEDGLREMVRDGKLPAERAGARGHLTISRCDLPRRLTPPVAAVSSIEERLLRKTARR